jgi:hypothetical protein
VRLVTVLQHPRGILLVNRNKGQRGVFSERISEKLIVLSRSWIREALRDE